MGSVRAVPYKDETHWGNRSKMQPTSYRTELDVIVSPYEQNISKIPSTKYFFFLNKISEKKFAYH